MPTRGIFFAAGGKSLFQAVDRKIRRGDQVGRRLLVQFSQGDAAVGDDGFAVLLVLPALIVRTLRERKRRR